MIETRRSRDRGRVDHGWLDARHTFSFGRYFDREHVGFRSLRVINEDRIAPGRGFGTHGHEDMEIITYIVSGALAHEDSMGSRSRLGPEDIQVMSAGSGILHSEVNDSEEDPVHLLQIWITPSEKGIEPRYAEKHYPREERQGRLVPVASGDGRAGSLTIGQDAAIFASVLDPGKTLQHSLGHDRHAWIQVVEGELELGSVTLLSGDGAAVSDESRVDMKALANTELLLFDLG